MARIQSESNNTLAQLSRLFPCASDLAAVYFAESQIAAGGRNQKAQTSMNWHFIAKALPVIVILLYRVVSFSEAKRKLGGPVDELVLALEQNVLDIDRVPFIS